MPSPAITITPSQIAPEILTASSTIITIAIAPEILTAFSAIITITCIRPLVEIAKSLKINT
jgi:hypothetical protein